MKRWNRSSLVALVMIAGAAVPPASAQTDLNKFPLIKAVPADVFIAVAARANPERQFLDQYWGEVTKAFHESGVLTDVWEMVTDAADDEALEKIEEIQEQFSAICKKVDWAGLFEKEMVHAGRFTATPGPSFYEGLMMGRMGSEQIAAANYEALKTILEEVVKLADANGAEGNIGVQETRKGGVAMAGLVPKGLPFSVLGIAWSKDVVCIYFGGPRLAEECFGLLNGESKAKSLVSTDRFKKAFAGLPPAEDTLVFFDTTEMFSRLDNMMKMISSHIGGDESEDASADVSEDGADADADEATEASAAKPVKKARKSGGGDDPGKAFMGLASKVLGDLGVVDYVAEVEWTDGYRVFTQSVSPLSPKAKSTGLYKIVTSGKPARNFEKFIPKEATTFSWSSGMKLTELYDYARSLVVGLGPMGEEGWAGFETFQKEQLKLDIKQDVLALFEGPIISVAMDDQWVIMFQVTDSKKAEAQVNRLFAEVNKMLGDENGLMLSPVKVYGDHSFKQISHPMMMMMGGMSPPVVGCAEGHLFLASSAKSVNTCLKTAAGKHADITKSKRWLAEAINPESAPVDAISFTDETKTGQELQGMLQGMAMGMGMMGMFAQEAPPQFRQIMQGIPPILAKLGPVAGKLNYYQSSADVTTFDGNKWMTKSVQNYKKPEDVKAEQGESAAGAAEEGDEAP